MKRYKPAVTECDEFELHDIVATLYHLELKANKNHEPVETIKIVPKGYEYLTQLAYDKKAGHPKVGKGGKFIYKRVKVKPFKPTKKAVKAVEDAVNALLAHMREVDSILHDNLEYTC